MSATSKIEWTEATWNPVRGCSRISPGCVNCYAERMAARGLPGMNSPTTGEPFAIMKSDGPHWTGKVELIPSMLDIPLRRKKPTTYFVNSMSDLFHEDLPDEAIDQVFAVMALCPQHTFQVLTKRAKRMREYSNAVTFERLRIWMNRSADGNDGLSNLTTIAHAAKRGTRLEFYRHPIAIPFVIPNVWLGVSVEDRARKDRIDELRETPAAIRFLSLEPLLEDLGALDLRGIDWVIVGGESGPGARPMHPDWARSLRDQCVAAGVPFFFKQWGAHRALGCADFDSDDWDAPAIMEANPDKSLRVALNGAVDDGNSEPLPHQIGAWMMERSGKHHAGRLLDGREWNEMPARGRA